MSSSTPPRSRSQTPKKKKKKSRRRRSSTLSPSRSPPPRRQRSRSRGRRGGGGGGSSSRSRSHSRYATKDFNDGRNEESLTLAIFNLYYKTDEDELRRIFGRYGKIEKCNIVNNRRRGQTTAFGFLSFENLDDARAAKDDAHGMEIDGNIIRTDYCMTKRSHSPTPGRYMGKRRQFYRSPSRERRRERFLRDRSSRDRDSRSRDRSYSPRAPRRSHSRARYRSPSPYRSSRR